MIHLVIESREGRVRFTATCDSIEAACLLVNKRESTLRGIGAHVGVNLRIVRRDTGTIIESHKLK